MKNYIYCTTTAKGEQSFYLMAQGTKYFLFVQAYRRSNKKVFEQGISLFDIRKLKKHHSYSVRHTAEKTRWRRSRGTRSPSPGRSRSEL